MIDVESQSIQNMSLRKRNNPQSKSSSKSIGRTTELKQHAQLMNEINAASDYDDVDDDEQTKELKEIIKKQQIKKTNQMTNLLLTILFGILFVVILLYIVVATYQPTDEPSLMNSLIKVFRILLGMKSNNMVLSSSTIVATTSIPKATLDEFLIPAWPWQRGASAAKKYLVPSNANSQVKQILHQSMKLKHERGINIQLYDNHMMRQFLTSHSDTCGMKSSTTRDIPHILQKFDELKKLNGQGHKYLWLWCMLYSGKTFGYLDIENHTIEMKLKLLRKLSLDSKIPNILISPDRESEDDGIDHSSTTVPLPTSLIFSSTPQSKVAEGMLQFLLHNTYNEESLNKELRRLVQGENWILLKAHCSSGPIEVQHDDDDSMAKICSKNENEQMNKHCCSLVL